MKTIVPFGFFKAENILKIAQDTGIPPGIVRAFIFLHNNHPFEREPCWYHFAKDWYGLPQEEVSQEELEAKQQERILACQKDRLPGKHCPSWCYIGCTPNNALAGDAKARR